MIFTVPPATGRILPPTETDPPIPTPTIIHPTCALAVCPPLTVTVFEALVSPNPGEVPVEVCVVVELAAVAGGGEDCGLLVDVGPDPREIGEIVFWRLVVPIVGLTGASGLAVGIVG